MSGRPLEDYLLEFRKTELPTIVPRELDAEPATGRITAIIGPRRAGKTYYFYQLARSKGKERCLYLNFEDTRLFGMDFRGIRGAVRAHVELFGSEPEYLLLDEVQAVEGWEVAVRELYDRRKYAIMVTGSSSRLLSKEVATQLRGRGVSYLLLPFSFREFLRARGMPAAGAGLTMDEEAMARNLLREYLDFGGFPQVALETGGEAERLRTLRTYSEAILYRDVVERHGIRNLHLSNAIFRQLASGFAAEFSVNKMYNHFRSQGVSLSKDTLHKYLALFEDSAGIFFLRRYSPKARLRESWPRKAYLCDTGLARVWRGAGGEGDGGETGRLMENAVFLELMRRGNERPLQDLHYWHDAHGEVDFVVSEGGKVAALLQVTYAAARGDVKARELKALLRAGEELGCRRLVVVTWSHEGTEDYEKAKVIFTPLWKFLMG